MNAPRLVISFKGDSLETVQNRLSSGAVRWVEVRVDLFPEVTPDEIRNVCNNLRASGAHMILTVRHPDEGGKPLPIARAEFFETCIDLVDEIDVELLHQDDLKDVLRMVRRKGKSVIFSYHNFEGTPRLSELEMLYDIAPLTSGDIFKIATMVASEEDIQRLIKFTVEHSGESIAVMGMGEKTKWLRYVLPLIGSKIAYAAPGNGTTAPGQPLVDEYIEIWNRMGVQWD